MKSSRPHLRFALLLPCLGLAVQAARAQTASPAPEGGAEQTIKLSPFEVKTDKDTGYIAADTLNAGRLSTNLLKTPGDIEVFTRDFINDLGVFNIDEAAGWMTNSRPQELGAIEGNSMNPASVGGADSATNTSFRGMGAQPSTRNYFLSAVTPKEYNVERIEASRGPNAILYGEGGPGGQTNYITKQAKDRDFTVIRARVDSERSEDFAVDINRVVNPNLDVRYNGDFQNKGYYISRDRSKELGNALDVIYRPFDRTSLNLAADYSINHRPIINIAYNDNYSLWNKVPIATTLTAAPAGSGLAVWTATHETYIEGQGLVNLKGTAYTSGVAIPAVTEYNYGIKNVVAPPPTEFNANPNLNQLEEHAADFQATLDHSWLNGLAVQLGAQYAKYREKGGNYAFVGDYIDPNQNLNGVANPNFGKMYSYSYLGHVTDGTERDSSTLRAVASYPINIRWLGTTTISAFLVHQQLNTRTVFSDYHDPSLGSILDSSTEIYIQRYWDNLPSSVPDFIDTRGLVKVPTNDVQVKNRADACEVAASGDYFHDTLTVIGGFRRDRSNFESETGVAASRTLTTGQFTQYTPDSRTGFNNTVSAGLTYFPEKYAGLYFNHAEGFTVSSATAPQLDGTYAHANIVPASDESFGLRFNLQPSSLITIQGDLGWYYAKQRNNTTAVGVASVNQIWANHGQPGKYIVTFDPNPLDTGSANAITSYKSVVGWGWEANFVVNVGNSLRFYINGALPNTKQSDVGADYTKYVNANLAQWTTWANDPANPTAASDKASLSQIQGFITGFQPGREQNLTYDYRANAFGVYTLPRTALKGLRIGGGYQLFGPSLIGNDIGLPFSYVYYRSYGLASGYLAYPVKLRKGTLDFQLNVSNALNYNRPIYNGLFIYQSTTNLPYGFHYSYPRVVRFSTTLSF